MAAKEANEILTVAGREVSISNPSKVLFPDAGYTKLDLVRYYVAVADGALRGAGGRPNVLVRYPNGIAKEFFFQKRAPDSRPDWLEAVTLSFPSGRTAEEIVPRDAAALAWMANLACIELHPHPVLASDLDHPDELRIDLDPVPGVEWPQIVEVARVVRATLTDFGLVGWPKTSGSRGIHVIVRLHTRWGSDDVRKAAVALAREVERRAPAIATSKWWKEERHGVFLDYNQNAKDRTVASAYSVRPKPDARVSAPLTWDEIDTCDPADFTLKTMPMRFAAIGDRHEHINEHPCTLDTLLALAERQAGEGQGDAPWPPHYKKQEGEPPRVQPSKSRAHKTTAKIESATDEASTATAAASARTTKARSKPATTADASSQVAAAPGRRTPRHPLIEIARSWSKDDALAGLERWKSQHAEVAQHLEPADVLVDSMRGKSSTWTRIRLNLQHVPAKMRPKQGALDPDEDVSEGSPPSASSRRRTPSKARTEP